MKKKLLIVIPKITYNAGVKEIIRYVDKILLPYNDETECDPHVIKSKNDIIKEYDEYKEEYPDIGEYCMKYYAGYIDRDGNLVSTMNDNAFWDMYEICDSECWYQENLDELKTTKDGVIDNCLPIDKLTRHREMCARSIDIIFDENGNIFNMKCCDDNIDEIFSRNKNEYVIYLECQ